MPIRINLMPKKPKHRMITLIACFLLDNHGLVKSAIMLLAVIVILLHKGGVKENEEQIANDIKHNFGPQMTITISKDYELCGTSDKTEMSDDGTVVSTTSTTFCKDGGSADMIVIVRKHTTTAK